MKKTNTISIELNQKQYDALILFFSAGEYFLQSSNPEKKKNTSGDEVYVKLFEKGPQLKSKTVTKNKGSYTLTKTAEKEINKGIKVYNHSVVSEAMLSMMVSGVKEKKN